MRGPIVFLASLLCVAALGGLLILPAYRSAPQTPPPAIEESPSSADAVEARIRDLRLAPPLTELSQQFAAPIDEGVYVLPWDRLPEFLRLIAAPRHATPDSLRVEATEDPSRCRVRLHY